MEDCCVCKESCDILISSFYKCKCKSTLHLECYNKLEPNNQIRCIICRQFSNITQIEFKPYKEFKVELALIKLLSILLFTTISLSHYYSLILIIPIIMTHYYRLEIDFNYVYYFGCSRYKTILELSHHISQIGIYHYRVNKSVVTLLIYLINQNSVKLKLLELINNPKDAETLILLNHLEELLSERKSAIPYILAIYILYTFDSYQVHSLYYIIYLVYNKFALRISNAV